MYFGSGQEVGQCRAGGGHISMREITDPARIAELNDTREVRLERQEKQQFHPDDPYRTITRSPPPPWTTCRIPRRHRPAWPTLVRATATTH